MAPHWSVTKRMVCLAAIFEKQGVPLECLGDGGKIHHMATYESAVLFVLRFMVDTGVVSL